MESNQQPKRKRRKSCICIWGRKNRKKEYKLAQSGEKTEKESKRKKCVMLRCKQMTREIRFGSSIAIGFIATLVFVILYPCIFFCVTLFFSSLIFQDVTDRIHLVIALKFSNRIDCHLDIQPLQIFNPRYRSNLSCLRCTKNVVYPFKMYKKCCLSQIKCWYMNLEHLS